jgi:aryl-phospho-beta-D-glucosidase BglC (GH1 family)
MRKLITAVVLAALAASCYGAGDFIRRSGRNLVVGRDNSLISLRGICFGNNVWSNPPVPPANHHGEKDFERVKAMRMNVIRFYLNYRLFEDDARPYEYKQSGWEWLDKNIAWAKKYGVYLILNMHVPQGGYQSGGEGMALWDDPENQPRLTALWRAIAERYKNEPVIAGYDILNEPYVSKSMDQWESLAGRLVSSIRKADKNHLIIVEKLDMIKGGDWRGWEQPNYFLVKDQNVMYTFHFYSPGSYTHQYTPWTDLRDKDGGKYPDPDSRIYLENGGYMPFDKDYLEFMIKAHVRWGIENNVPMFIGEFGAYRECFKNGKNGVGWVRDVVDLAKENNVNFTYHCYHESAFGVYQNDAGLPDPGYSNEALRGYFEGGW